jgi:hypothetical protein
MSLARRAPREVYRVYGEREYLAGVECETPLPPDNAERVTERRAARLASVALLLGAAGALTGLTILDSIPHRRPTGRRFTARVHTFTFTTSAPVSGLGMRAGVRVPSSRPSASPRRHMALSRRLRARVSAQRNGEDASRAGHSVSKIAGFVSVSAPIAASGSPVSEGTPQPEFGFER